LAAANASTSPVHKSTTNTGWLSASMRRLGADHRLGRFLRLHFLACSSERRSDASLPLLDSAGKILHGCVKLAHCLRYRDPRVLDAALSSTHARSFHDHCARGLFASPKVAFTLARASSNFFSTTNDHVLSKIAQHHRALTLGDPIGQRSY